MLICEPLSTYLQGCILVAVNSIHLPDNNIYLWAIILHKLGAYHLSDGIHSEWGFSTASKQVPFICNGVMRMV